MKKLDYAPGYKHFNKGNILPVMKKVLLVEVVDGRHRFTVLRTSQMPTEPARARVNRPVTTHISVDYISWKNRKPLSDREVLKLPRLATAMSGIFLRVRSLVVLLSSVLRAPVTFASE